MIGVIKRVGLVAYAALFLMFMLAFFLKGYGEPYPYSAEPYPGSAAQAASTTIRDIKLAYKLDPRAVDPFRGVGPWTNAPNYAGINAQDTVEVRAHGVDANGRPVQISPEWVPSDPEMVTVEPSQGDDVTIKVHRAGESKLKITYQGVSKELEITAKYVGKFMLFDIAEVKAAKAAAPTVAKTPPAPESKSDVSYAAGMSLAKALQEQSVEVDVDSLIQGFKDELSGAKTRLTEQEALAALQGLETDQRVLEAGLNRKAVAEKNKREGEAFLAANKNKEGVVTLPDGLQYKIIKAGEGKKPAANDTVSVRYRGTFIDGQEFDNTFGRPPVIFPVKTTIVKGLTEALQLMPQGSRWQLFLPPELAFGEKGAGGGGGKRAGGPRPQVVGPNATVIFEVELVSVQGDPDPGTAVATNE